jgi:protein-serine/threonine kinase
MIISHAPSPSPEIFYSTPLPSAQTIPALDIPAALDHQQQHQHLQEQASPSASSPTTPVQNDQLKPADYVYYHRRPEDLSSDARTRATAAKVKLESYYKNALETAIDLNVQ